MKNCADYDKKSGYCASIRAEANVSDIKNISLFGLCLVELVGGSLLKLSSEKHLLKIN